MSVVYKKLQRARGCNQRTGTTFHELHLACKLKEKQRIGLFADLSYIGGMPTTAVCQQHGALGCLGRTWYAYYSGLVLLIKTS